MKTIDYSDPKNSKYYAVIVQYEARHNNSKMIASIRALVDNPRARKWYNYRLCPEEVSGALTGYYHNAVTPLGMVENIPIILSSRILKLRDQGLDMWLGGGEVDLKVRLPIDDFINIANPLVLDVTDDE
jgi:prolyl-tRNA editing enzyme YbaK/EbsC (Cys-tRNA(Pro) deacylase)